MLNSGALKSALLIFAVSSSIWPALASAQQSTAFSQLAGSWKGSGQIRLEDGHSERLSCRGFYKEKTKGSELSLAIQCRSAANSIDMHGDLVLSNGRLSGHWGERTFSAEGELNGSASANRLNLSISGPITGSMAVTVNGGKHQVAITTAGPGLKGVSISFSRG
jgi:hypothetical protein